MPDERPASRASASDVLIADRRPALHGLFTPVSSGGGLPWIGSCGVADSGGGVVVSPATRRTPVSHGPHDHHGHEHDHPHEHEYEHGHTGAGDPALDLAVPDAELNPGQLRRRGFLQAAGILGAGLASASVLSGSSA